MTKKQKKLETTINFRTDKQTKIKLIKQAKMHNRNLSNLMNIIVKDWLAMEAERNKN